MLLAQQLESYLETVAKENHVILVPKEAVIAGGVDLTVDVRRIVSVMTISSLVRNAFQSAFSIVMEKCGMNHQ